MVAKGELTMDLIKAHKIMENELRCVQRASVNACDRDCKHCDLLMDTNEIIQAYGIVIKILEEQITIEKIKEEIRLSIENDINKTNI